MILLFESEDIKCISYKIKEHVNKFVYEVRGALALVI